MPARLPAFPTFLVFTILHSGPDPDGSNILLPSTTPHHAHVVAHMHDAKPSISQQHACAATLV
jgi:hypothetical protein